MYLGLVPIKNMSQSQEQSLSPNRVAPSRHIVVLPNISYPSRSPSNISWSRSLDPKRFSVSFTLHYFFLLDLILPLFFLLEKYGCPFSANLVLFLRVCCQSAVFFSLDEGLPYFRLLPLAVPLRSIMKTILISARSHTHSVVCGV